MRTAVITGVAQGIGREVAKLLASGGTSIGGCDVDAASLGSLGDELARTGTLHLLEPVDIADRAAIARFRDAVLARFDTVDLVLANAGVGFFGPLEEADLEKAARCLEINVLGTAATFQAFIPVMRARRAGRLVAISSMVGRIPYPFESIYVASKFAVEGLVRTVRYELAPFGIEVGLIEPAQVSTAFAAKILHRPGDTSPYRDRVARFIERDQELVEAAPTPARAAARIVRIVTAPRLRVASQLDARSTLLLAVQKVVPQALQDALLLRYLRLRP